VAENSENINGFLKGKVKFVIMRGVEKGVAIDGDRFLHVKFENNKCLVKLHDLKEKKAITGWITLNNVENLRTSRNSKPVRDKLKGKLENVIQIVQDNIHRWLEKSGEKEVSEEALPKFAAEVESKINDEVKRILEADNQLESLKPHLDNVIVGEDNNKLTIFVLLIGSKSSSAKLKVIVILRGTSGGGKSNLAKGTTGGYNVNEVGRFTTHALDYSDLEDFEVLYVKELGKMDEEKSGVSTLKFLSADDEGYNVQYTTRDERTGRLRTEKSQIPCITVISTTTRLVLDPQIERRAWLLTVDESEELTKKVLKAKAKRERQESEKKMGLREITDYEYSKEVIRRFVKQIKLQTVIIPFPNTLTETYSSKFLRLRGDIDKIYTFIKLYGSLNLKRLWKLNGEVYVVTPEVAVEALNTIKVIVSQMLVKIETRTKEVLEALNEIDVNAGLTDPRFTGEEAHPIRIHPNLEGIQINKQIREQIARHLRVSDDTVRKRLNALCSAGYLSSDEAKGRKGKTFTLLYDVDEILIKLTEESGILRSPHSLMAEMEKEAQDWLEEKCGIQLEGILLTSLMETTQETKPLPKLATLAKPNVENKEVRASPESIPHSSLKENQGDSKEMTEKNAENKENRISGNIRFNEVDDISSTNSAPANLTSKVGSHVLTTISKEKHKEKNEESEEEHEDEDYLDDEPLTLVDWLVRNI